MAGVGNSRFESVPNGVASHTTFNVLHTPVPQSNF